MIWTTLEMKNEKIEQLPPEHSGERLLNLFIEALKLLSWNNAEYFSWKYIVNVKGLKVKSCPTLCDPVDCSLPGSPLHGIFQAIVLEWIAISFSRGSSRPGDRTRVSCIVDRRFTVWATRAVQAIREALIRETNLDGISFLLIGTCHHFKALGCPSMVY